MAAPVTNIEEFVARAQQMRDDPARAILAIAGPPGAGKSKFAEALLAALNGDQAREDTALLPMDGFHLRNEILIERGLRDRKGAPETFDSEGFVDLLRNVREQPAKEWFAPGFDRSIEEPVPNQFRIGPEVKLVITEGNYLLLRVGEWASIKPLCDETWFLEVDPEIERKRLIKRQQEGGKTAEEAESWVEQSDLLNADLVRSYSAPGNRFIRIAEGVI